MVRNMVVLCCEGNKGGADGCAKERRERDDQSGRRKKENTISYRGQNKNFVLRLSNIEISSMCNVLECKIKISKDEKHKFYQGK